MYSRWYVVLVDRRILQILRKERDFEKTKPNPGTVHMIEPFESLIVDSKCPTTGTVVDWMFQKLIAFKESKNSIFLDVPMVI